MSGLESGEQGDRRYYQRPLNFRFIWNLAHAPRRRMYERFVSALKPQAPERVLDLGAANLPEPLENMFELYYPHADKITAAGVEDCSFLEKRHPGLKFVKTEPGKPLPWPDGHFELGFSNGVIEHVGSRAQQKLFLSEFLRVTKRAFLATPNRWFPLEMHTRLPFVHWLPAPIFRGLLEAIGLSFYADEKNLNLLTAGELLALVPEKNRAKARLEHNTAFGFPSNLMLIVGGGGES